MVARGERFQRVGLALPGSCCGLRLASRLPTDAGARGLIEVS
jgi:hypothetical protein